MYFDTGVKGEFQLFKIDPVAHRLTQVTSGSRAVSVAEHRASGRGMVYLVNDFTHLDDVYSAPLDAKSERKLSNHNAALCHAHPARCSA